MIVIGRREGRARSLSRPFSRLGACGIEASLLPPEAEGPYDLVSPPPKRVTLRGNGERVVMGVSRPWIIVPMTGTTATGCDP